MIGIVLGLRGRLWQGAVAALLSQQDDLEILGQRERLEDVWPTVRRARPDLVVLDAELPGDVTLEELCRRLCERRADLRVLILMERWLGVYVGLARLTPRVGFLSTDCSPAQLFDSVRRLAHGEAVLDLGLAVAALSAGSNPLTDREREVLARSVDGAPAKAIAAELFLSTGTVRNYLSRATAKTGARCRVEAVRIARDAGWI
jgi:two-component system response regulator DesR